MKSPFGYRTSIIATIILVLAQAACGIGAQSSNSGAGGATTSPQESTQTPAASTSEHGAVDEALSMLQKAVAHYNTVGRKQALADFTGRVPPFFDRDLYVACMDETLVMSANGGFPNLVGSTIIPLNRATWDAASENQVSSIDYSYLNPVTKLTEAKTLYYEKVGKDVCGVGVYHP